MTYGVTAQIVIEQWYGFVKTVQIPHFRIDASSEDEAKRKAEEIINPTNAIHFVCHICVEPI